MIQAEEMFACPECGGRYFGSYQRSDGVLIRHCQDNLHGCTGRWPETEDWKHRRIVLRFSSEAEYEKAMRQYGLA